MNWVDITILVILAGSALAGLFSGLIRQAVTMIGFIGGVLLAGRIYQPIADFLHAPDGGGLIPDENWARVIAFGAVVIGFSLLIGAAGSLLRMVTGLLFLGWLDHVLGAALGLVMALFPIAAILIAATVFPVPGLSDPIKHSAIAQAFNGLVPLVLAMLPPEFGIARQLAGLGAP